MLGADYAGDELVPSQPDGCAIFFSAIILTLGTVSQTIGPGSSDTGRFDEKGDILACDHAVACLGVFFLVGKGGVEREQRVFAHCGFDVDNPGAVDELFDIVGDIVGETAFVSAQQYLVGARTG